MYLNIMQYFTKFFLSFSFNFVVICAISELHAESLPGENKGKINILLKYLCMVYVMCTFCIIFMLKYTICVL